jgi:hypothetical protein
MISQKDRHESGKFFIPGQFVLSFSIFQTKERRRDSDTIANGVLKPLASAAHRWAPASGFQVEGCEHQDNADVRCQRIGF